MRIRRPSGQKVRCNRVHRCNGTFCPCHRRQKVTFRLTCSGYGYRPNALVKALARRKTGKK
jgi:hypothetical protein